MVVVVCMTITLNTHPIASKVFEMAPTRLVHSIRLLLAVPTLGSLPPQKYSLKPAEVCILKSSKTNCLMSMSLWLCVCLLLTINLSADNQAAALAPRDTRFQTTLVSDPDADRFNYGIGTQTFSPLYQFTDKTKLVETAEAMHGMGSTTIKFFLGKGFDKQYGVSLSPSTTNLVALAQNEPSCRTVLGMPFQQYLLWTYCFTSPGWWADGFSAAEKQAEYRKVYDLARYLLTHYANSGKRFYLGHWEGDWYLLPGYNVSITPSSTAIQGMRDWLNTRQQAVDDAKRDTPHPNVDVFAYAEVNRVRDAMDGKQRVINAVVPFVTNLDFVSYSSYDMQDLSPAEITATLDYAESRIPTRKAGGIPGKRLFIGEYGWGAEPPDIQESRSRKYARTLLAWGCPFVLWWEMFNNEPDRSFHLVNPKGEKTPNYYFHQRFLNAARLWVAGFKQTNGRVPTAKEYQNWAVTQLNNPLPPPVSLNVRNQSAIRAGTNAVVLTGTLRQGIYGDPWGHVFVAWGAGDGNTDPAQWEHVVDLGINSRFDTNSFRARLNALEPNTTFHCRFYATNASGMAWAETSSSVTLSSP
jgi:hypothetical protein